MPRASLSLLLVVSFFIAALGPCDPPAAGPDCASDDDCHGDVCVDGRCVECVDDDDCDVGERCERNGCVGEIVDEDTVLQRACERAIACDAETDAPADCVRELAGFIANLRAGGEGCDDVAAAFVAFYRCVGDVEDCAVFVGEPGPETPCGAEYAAFEAAYADDGERCTSAPSDAVDAGPP